MNATSPFQNVFSFSEIHKDRIGQLINYIALKQDHLYCTRLIKLLYIIDERSILKLGTPITWMTFYVYEMGPVPEKLWFSIKDGNDVFGEYFDVIEETNTSSSESNIKYRIKPIDQENMSEFSRREKEIVDSVISEFGSVNVDKLIKYLHRDDSLWNQKVKSNNITFDKSSTTTHVIDLSDLIAKDGDKLSLYRDTKLEINLLESL